MPLVFEVAARQIAEAFARAQALVMRRVVFETVI